LENVPFLEWIADVGPGPEQSALRHETADDMQRILDTLPVKYRAVLLLRYWHDFSYEEIAQTLDLTPALVKARLHRARELVARTMKAQGLDMTLASEETDEREHGKIAAGDVGLAAH
ncbi:MAG TPA: RNA polymerase sigma factor, partial [Ktedonobacterales bacterium]|nr:RNA polymerase sigma factor [Ktedonobacterales bacterium]